MFEEIARLKADAKARADAPIREKNERNL